jgi:transcription elongation factor Elf1
MPAPEKIAKEFPKEGDLQLFRLEKSHEFQCIRCQEQKKSKLVVVQSDDWSKLLCNGCYGLLLSQRK